VSSVPRATMRTLKPKKTKNLKFILKNLTSPDLNPPVQNNVNN